MGAISSWEALEPCDADLGELDGPGCSTNDDCTGPGETCELVPETGMGLCVRQELCLDKDNPELPAAPCFCTYDLRLLDGVLTFHVSHTTTTNPLACDGGRHALIQLSPVFTLDRTVPPYLLREPLDSLKFFESFTRLWDRVSDLLADPNFRLSPTNRAAFIISIGNEIDGYLNDPERDLQSRSERLYDAVDGPPVQAWGPTAPSSSAPPHTSRAKTSRYPRRMVR